MVQDNGTGSSKLVLIDVQQYSASTSERPQEQVRLGPLSTKVGIDRQAEMKMEEDVHLQRRVSPGPLFLPLSMMGQTGFELASFHAYSKVKITNDVDFPFGQNEAPIRNVHWRKTAVWHSSGSFG